MDRDEYINERAAIMEYDGKRSRVEAERFAAMEWSNKIERVAREAIARSRERKNANARHH